MSDLAEIVPADVPVASPSIRQSLPFTFAQQHGVLLDTADDGATIVVHIGQPKVQVLTELRRVLGASFVLQEVPEGCAWVGGLCMGGWGG